MKIAIAIPCWGRPRVLFNALWSLARQQTEHEVDILCATSPDDPLLFEVVSACDEIGVGTVSVPNLPLGQKWNMLTKVGMELFDFDYMLTMGSDDIVSPNFVDAYPWDELPMAFGWSDIYFMGPERKLLYWPGYGKRRDESVGAGRIVRRDVVERMQGELWDPSLSRGLDGSMVKRLRSHGIEVPHRRMPEGVYMVDVETSESITPVSDYVKAGDVLEEKGVPQCLSVYLCSI